MNLLSTSTRIFSCWKMCRESDHWKTTQKASIFFCLLKILIYSKLNNKRAAEVRLLNFRIEAFDYGSLIFLIQEIFLEHQYYFYTKKDNPLVIDCGANIGVSMLYFKSIYPNCQLILFEPNPQAFEKLKANVYANKLQNVLLYNIALSDNDNIIKFFTGSKSGAASLVGSTFSSRGGEDSFCEVNARRLSTFIVDLKPDLIKMDVEGAEDSIIAELSSSNTLQNASKYIIEYHHNIDHKQTTLPHFLLNFERNGYAIHFESISSYGSSFQDLLIRFDLN